MKKRIVRFSAFVRTHSVRVLVPDKTNWADKLARFGTCSLCPATNKAQKCADSGMCMGCRCGVRSNSLELC